MSDKKINRIEPESRLTDYLGGRKTFPKEIGSFRLEGEKSDSEIAYYSWDLSFTEVTDAQRPNNSGIDEVQIMFNLSRDIEWEILSDKTGTFKNKKVSLKKGELCVVRNNDACTGMRYEKDCDFKFKSLQMPTERFEDLINRFFKREDSFHIKDMIFHDVKLAVITPEMYRIISELDSLDKYKEYKGVFLEGKVMELTALVLYAIAYQKKETEYTAISGDSRDVSELEKLRESIQLKPYENYPAEDVALSLNMSVSKLNRLFRSLYGTSLHAYVQTNRLEYAANLLRSGTCTVTEAALKAGYNNMSYFSKAFFEYFKTTPKKYSML
jgi:AraC-like DNA-binding protein